MRVRIRGKLGDPWKKSPGRRESQDRREQHSPEEVRASPARAQAWWVPSGDLQHVDTACLAGMSLIALCRPLFRLQYRLQRGIEVARRKGDSIDDPVHVVEGSVGRG
jgi:hypothetical protein